jgi:hypothetical protein
LFLIKNTHRKREREKKLIEDHGTMMNHYKENTLSAQPQPGLFTPAAKSVAASTTSTRRPLGVNSTVRKPSQNINTHQQPNPLRLSGAAPLSFEVFDDFSSSTPSSTLPSSISNAMNSSCSNSNSNNSGSNTNASDRFAGFRKTLAALHTTIVPSDALLMGRGPVPETEYMPVCIGDRSVLEEQLRQLQMQQDAEETIMMPLKMEEEEGALQLELDLDLDL